MSWRLTIVTINQDPCICSQCCCVFRGVISARQNTGGRKRILKERLLNNVGQLLWEFFCWQPAKILDSDACPVCLGGNDCTVSEFLLPCASTMTNNRVLIRLGNRRCIFCKAMIVSWVAHKACKATSKHQAGSLKHQIKTIRQDSIFMSFAAYITALLMWSKHHVD